MKIFYPKITYSKASRSQLFPLLKPFIKEGEFTDEQRQTLYAISEQDLSFVNELEQADLAILPMSWNYYVTENKQKEAISFVELANSFKLTVWIVMLGDVGWPIPDFKQVIVFRASGYKSKLPAWHKGLPVFITDPLKAHYNTTNVFKRSYSIQPTVGFCGLASKNLWNASKTLSKIALKNIGYYFKIYPQMPEELIAAPYFRYRCLKPMMHHQEINDNFILREKYRAGALTKEQREQSSLEFYNNIKDSDYVLCVRGAGNFSVRLYETLAMGRIPIYINSDGLLPLQDKINWKKHMVWIEKHELSNIAEKVMAFHKKLDEVKLNALCQSNRDLWLKQLQMGTFFKNNFDEH